MLEYCAPPEHPPAGSLSLHLVLGLDCLDAFPQLREHLRLGPELGKDREPHPASSGTSDRGMDCAMR